MLRYLALIAVLAVCGCTTPHKLAVCHGPLTVMNTSHWRPTASDVTALDQICPEEK
jgi:hypothetical protein